MNKIINEDKEKMLLESMIGAPVSRTAGVQIPIDSNLPIDFPQSTIHYELYRRHIELHIESQNYISLCRYLNKNLPKNEISQPCDRSFCKFAYVLNKEVKGWIDIEELGNAINELRNIVEPVLLSYCHQTAENMKLAKELAEYYKKQKEEQPFHINVIDELHANENAHTRILTRLLKYKTEGSNVILSSFLSLLPNFNESIDDINNSIVDFNQDFIDCLVECPGKFAVIVENKIHNAEDQNKQIERYVNTEISKGIPEDKIWAIYLTSDGRKTVEKRSLTEKAKKVLVNRFITMNYRNDILPWLKDSILPNCKLREDWLIAALKQYVDHLEGMFGMRSSQSELRKNMDKVIFSHLGVTKDMSISEKYSCLRDFTYQVEALQNILETSSSSLVKPVMEKLRNTTLEVLSKTCPDQDVDFFDGLANGFFQLFIQSWKNRAIHFEWIPFDKRRLMCGNDYYLVVHIEDKKLENYTNSLLEENQEIAEEGQNLGFSKIGNRTFYKKGISTIRSIADMTHNELVDFLKDMYSDIPPLISFINKHIIRNTRQSIEK